MIVNFAGPASQAHADVAGPRESDMFLCECRRHSGKSMVSKGGSCLPAFIVAIRKRDIATRGTAAPPTGAGCYREAKASGLSDPPAPI